MSINGETPPDTEVEPRVGAAAVGATSPPVVNAFPAVSGLICPEASIARKKIVYVLVLCTKFSVTPAAVTRVEIVPLELEPFAPGRLPVY
jgi:hypothetical protein